MDDFIVNVRQIGQYPVITATAPTDLYLLQQNGLGGPYATISPNNLVSSALQLGGWLRLAPNNGIAWNGASLTFSSSGFAFSEQLFAPTINAQNLTVNGQPVATLDYVNQLSNDVFNGTVHSFNGRTGTVQLVDQDILRAGGVLQWNPHFAGTVLVPTIWDPRTSNDQAASTAWVQHTICHWLETAPLVQSFNGRTGAVVLTAADVTAAAYLEQGQYIRAPNPSLGDVSDRVATCAFVDESIMDLQDTLQGEINDAISGAYAPINSPQFTGIPTTPTASPGTNTGQIASTAFVIAQVAASTAGVATWNGRTGAVIMAAADLTAAGGALLNSPTFTGVPQAPTPIPGNSSTQLATTAFVGAAIAALPAGGVTSWNTRTGAVTLTTADITGAGGAILASPAFTGNPTAPTQAPATNNTTLATTAFVTAAMSSVTAGVSSFNSRTGAVTLQANDISAAGGALLASPGLTGVPTAPTATVGTASTQLATTAFVQNQIAAIASGVSSWNTRTGAVTMTGADITTAGGALLNSPGLTGTPTTPTAAPGTSTAQIASTAFVQTALAAAPGGVSSFNSRTGAITLLLADISAAGGAPINSPSFTGTVTGPTATAGTNSNQLATTQFVMSAISTSGGVNSFNGRAGAVVLNATDIISATGATYAQADTAPVTGANNTFWFDSLHGQLYVQYNDPSTHALNWVIANSPPAQPIPAYPGQLSGLTLGYSTASVITIGSGAACSSDGSTTMVLTSTNFAKALGGPWTAGSGNAGLDTGTFAASTWYHVYLIMNPTTAAVDVLFSVATAPLMPSGFSLNRRIGSIKTDASSHILPFTQVGDHFQWTATPTGWEISNAGAAVAPGTLFTVNSPLGVKTIVSIDVVLTAPSVLRMCSPEETTVNPPGNLSLYTGAGQTAGQFTLRTNTSSQILVVVQGGAGNNIANGFYMSTHSWIDYRGK